MSRRWPKLVRPELCRTPVTVTLTDGENADGAPDGVLVLSLMCRLDDAPQENISPNRDFGDGARRSINAERVVRRRGGVALFDGDIAPEREVLTGSVEIGGQSWRIEAAAKARNPDGSVNYTRLTLA